MSLSHDYNTDADWLAGLVEELTDESIKVTVSEWAEEKRILPRSVSPIPGHYSFSVAPYLREPADAMSINSNVRIIDIMKGAQIGATVGVLENFIGYCIDHIKSAPVMLLTADAELARLRLDSYITPMLQHSKLSHLIQSADEENNRRTGRTSKKIEWAGGGFLVPYGAQNADKLRSVSIQYLLEDEVDAFPERVGKDGDPQKLAEERTKGYYQAAKIVRISTPLIKHRSRIERGFKGGDQRYYFVPCRSCGGMQKLVFQGSKKETGEAFGLVWTTSDGTLDPESVRYICEHCGHGHTNNDKSWMLPRGEWRATAKPIAKNRRSYHISGLYSPIGMYPWDAIVADWLEAWDPEAQTVKDIGLLQAFYNNNLGNTFEIIGSRVRIDAVTGHTRPEYQLGEIPNTYAAKFSGSKIHFLTCQVDVHKANLAVAVMGWADHARVYVIDYWRFKAEEGEDCTEPGATVWSRLRALIEEKVYTADDGQTYKIAMTFVDAGYSNDTVTAFCAPYTWGVYPILGRDRPAKNQSIKEFGEFKTQSGTTGYKIVVDHYKDRMAAVLRREWHEEAGPQRPYHFNAPAGLTRKQLLELTVEIRVEKVSASGVVSYGWDRPGGAANELWDLLGYGYAAVEVLAWNICVKHFGLETIDWPQFWEYCASPDNAALLARG
jgi:phage terminase large subunit GpA-like protein